MDKNNADVDLLVLLASLTPADLEATAAADAERVAADAARTIKAKRRARCGKCHGTGHIERFRHISGGDCFACSGGMGVV